MDPRAIHPYASAQHIMPLFPGPRGKNFCPGDARFGMSVVVRPRAALSQPTITPTRCALSGSRSRRPFQSPSTRTPRPLAAAIGRHDECACARFLASRGSKEAGSVRRRNTKTHLRRTKDFPLGSQASTNGQREGGGDDGHDDA